MTVCSLIVIKRKWLGGSPQTTNPQEIHWILEWQYMSVLSSKLTLNREMKGENRITGYFGLL